jgi:hypothetical protein
MALFTVKSGDNVLNRKKYHYCGGAIKIFIVLTVYLFYE